MKVEVHKDETLALPERAFPWVGISQVGHVVFFLEPGRGVLIAGNTYVGLESSAFKDEAFEPFNGTLIISENLPR
jgi:hypothetical protein